MCNIKFYDPKSCSWIKSVDKSERACEYIEGLDLDKIAYVTAKLSLGDFPVRCL